MMTMNRWIVFLAFAACTLHLSVCALHFVQFVRDKGIVAQIWQPRQQSSP